METNSNHTLCLYSDQLTDLLIKVIQLVHVTVSNGDLACYHYYTCFNTYLTFNYLIQTKKSGCHNSFLKKNINDAWSIFWFCLKEFFLGENTILHIPLCAQVLQSRYRCESRVNTYICANTNRGSCENIISQCRIPSPNLATVLAVQTLLLMLQKSQLRNWRYCSWQVKHKTDFWKTRCLWAKGKASIENQVSMYKTLCPSWCSILLLILLFKCTKAKVFII